MSTSNTSESNPNPNPNRTRSRGAELEDRDSEEKHDFKSVGGVTEEEEGQVGHGHVTNSKV